MRLQPLWLSATASGRPSLSGVIRTLEWILPSRYSYILLQAALSNTRDARIPRKRLSAFLVASSVGRGPSARLSRSWIVEVVRRQERGRDSQPSVSESLDQVRDVRREVPQAALFTRGAPGRVLAKCSHSGRQRGCVRTKILLIDHISPGDHKGHHTGRAILRWICDDAKPASSVIAGVRAAAALRAHRQRAEVVAVDQNRLTAVSGLAGPA